MYGHVYVWELETSMHLCGSLIFPITALPVLRLSFLARIFPVKSATLVTLSISRDRHG